MSAIDSTLINAMKAGEDSSPGSEASSEDGNGNGGFVFDEVVLIQNQNRWYKGKILEVAANNTESANVTSTSSASAKFKYRVHYFGWSSAFDEWIEEPEKRLKRFTADNELMALRQARKAYLCDRMEKEALAGEAYTHAKNNDGLSPSSDTVEVGQKRSARDANLASDEASSSTASPGETSSKYISAQEAATKGINNEGEYHADMVPGSSIVIRFTGNIRRLAVADWEAITKRNEIVPLPRIPSVSDILAEFAAQRYRGTGQQSQIEEVVSGLCVLFDRALPACLLYRLERPQYVDVTKAHPSVRPSRIYGAEHLVRLLLKLPVLLAHTRMDILELDALESRVGDLVKWLQTRVATFAAEYQLTDKEYRRRATIFGNEWIAAGTKMRDSAYLLEKLSEVTDSKNEDNE